MRFLDEKIFLISTIISKCVTRSIVSSSSLVQDVMSFVCHRCYDELFSARSKASRQIGPIPLYRSVLSGFNLRHEQRRSCALFNRLEYRR